MMKCARKVLFIAYDFPPCPQRGGAIRSEKFVKYLGEFGWKTVVLSSSYKKFSDPDAYPNVHRIQSFLPVESPYRLSPYGWIPALYLYGRQLLEKERFDLIYITCPPFPQSLAGVLLKRRSGLPFVVDFRDAWSLDPYSAKVDGINRLFHRHVFPEFENYLLKHADLFLTNSPSAYSQYMRLYPQLDSRIRLLPNGFDEQDFTDVKAAPRTETMTLLYTGRFGVAARNPEFLLKAIKLLIDNGMKLQFKILGDDRKVLFDLRERLGLQMHLTISGPVGHAQALQAMAECDILVLYQQDSDASVSAIAGKTYEYLRIGKPILAIAPSGDNLQIVRSYASTYKEVSTFNSNDVACAVKSLYDLWIKGELSATCKKNNEDYRRTYNRCELARQLASHFNSMVS